MKKAKIDAEIDAGIAYQGTSLDPFLKRKKFTDWPVNL